MSEWADPYTVPGRIPGTNVLGNKVGILPEALKQFDYEQSASRIEELREKPIQGRFDLDHLRAIHRQIFQDVYQWAGEVRTVNLSKAAPHSPMQRRCNVKACGYRQCSSARMVSRG